MRWNWRGSRVIGPLLVALAVALTACGDKEEIGTPTSAPASPPASAPTSTVQPIRPGAETSPVAGFGAETTVGALADRIAAAWTGVTSYRVNEITFPSAVATPLALAASPVASPVAGPTTPSTFAIDEVVLPDRKRRRIIANQEPVSEIVAVSGQVYAQGEVVRTYVDPALPSDAWVALSAQDLAGETPFGQVLQGFLAPIGAPLSAISPEQRTLPMTFVRQITSAGRTCDLYHVVQTTLTGDRIDVEIAIDANGLPCLIQTSGGGQTTVATYVAFNEPLTIEAPADVVAIPAASPTAPPSPAAG